MLLPLIGALLSLYGCHDLTAPERLAAPDTSSGALDPAGAVVVSPAEMHGSWFMNDDTGVCSDATRYRLVSGPAATPLGTGSAELAAAADATLALDEYAGTRLDHISALAYSTFRQTADVASRGSLCQSHLWNLGTRVCEHTNGVRVCDRGGQFGRPAPPARDCRRRVLQRAGSERESWPHHEYSNPTRFGDTTAHGTAVASVIAAVGRPNRGMTGVMWRANVDLFHTIPEGKKSRTGAALDAIDRASASGAPFGIAHRKSHDAALARSPTLRS